MVYCPPQTTILTGLDTATLTAALKQAQQGYIDLMSGNKGESFTYTQGDGTKSVVYTRANVANLVNLIKELQQALGITRRGRRPINLIYR